jgi:hypothetical protein
MVLVKSICVLQKHGITGACAILRRDCGRYHVHVLYVFHRALDLCRLKIWYLIMIVIVRFYSVMIRFIFLAC